ncbi:MAG: iron-containing alcohol dehydrogenase [Lachnospiraceae bacterium]|nr:iron-containing alcohol dehydrogenase [Lachnospiraceae bacterium]
MSNWIYKQPVEIIFGSGKIKELSGLCEGYVRPVIVCDKFFETNGQADDFKRILNTELLFSDISPNPDVTEVNRCSCMIRESEGDIIVAFGGGSAMDLAKAASLGVDRIEEYHGTGKAVPGQHIPVIAVPTTSGTGSEVTCVSVLTDRSISKKCPINSESFYPAAAIIDPELTLSVPPKVTASTGIDVLCHAVEGYWSTGYQPICDALAAHSAKLVFEWLPKVYDRPDDLEARESLAEASVIAGLAFTLPKTTGSHACSFPLTSIYGIPHGEACGLTLDYFARVNAKDKRTQNLARLLGFNNVGELADGILSLKKRVGLRTDLKDLKLDDDQIDELVRLSHHPNLDNNPIPVSDEILYRMYRGYI